jgi:hypothetical protein
MIKLRLNLCDLRLLPIISCHTAWGHADWWFLPCTLLCNLSIPMKYPRYHSNATFISWPCFTFLTGPTMIKLRLNLCNLMVSALQPIGSCHTTFSCLLLSSHLIPLNYRRYICETFNISEPCLFCAADETVLAVIERLVKADVAR